LQSRLAKQAFQVKILLQQILKTIIDFIQLQSRLAKQAFQVSLYSTEKLKEYLDDIFNNVAIPPSKAGISRPSWKPLCAMGNFVKKL